MKAATKKRFFSVQSHCTKSNRRLDLLVAALMVTGADQLEGPFWRLQIGSSGENVLLSAGRREEPITDQIMANKLRHSTNGLKQKAPWPFS